MLQNDENHKSPTIFEWKRVSYSFWINYFGLAKGTFSNKYMMTFSDEIWQKDLVKLFKYLLLQFTPLCAHHITNTENGMKLHNTKSVCFCFWRLMNINQNSFVAEMKRCKCCVCVSLVCWQPAASHREANKSGTELILLHTCIYMQTCNERIVHQLQRES